MLRRACVAAKNKACKEAGNAAGGAVGDIIGGSVGGFFGSASKKVVNKECKEVKICESEHRDCLKRCGSGGAAGSSNSTVTPTVQRVESPEERAARKAREAEAAQAARRERAAREARRAQAAEEARRAREEQERRRKAEREAEMLRRMKEAYQAVIDAETPDDRLALGLNYLDRFQLDEEAREHVRQIVESAERDLLFRDCSSAENLSFRIEACESFLEQHPDDSRCDSVRESLQKAEEAHQLEMAIAHERRRETRHKKSNALMISGGVILALGCLSTGLAALHGDRFYDGEYDPKEERLKARIWSGGMWLGLVGGSTLLLTGAILHVKNKKETPMPELSIAPASVNGGLNITLTGEW